MFQRMRAASKSVEAPVHEFVMPLPVPEHPQPEIVAPPKIKEALSRTHNPFASFGNAEHPASRKELANVLALLICHLGDWRDLGANEFEVAHSIGRLIDSFEPPSVPDK